MPRRTPADLGRENVYTITISGTEAGSLVNNIKTNWQEFTDEFNLALDEAQADVALKNSDPAFVVIRIVRRRHESLMLPSGLPKKSK